MFDNVYESLAHWISSRVLSGITLRNGNLCKCHPYLPFFSSSPWHRNNSPTMLGPTMWEIKWNLKWLVELKFIMDWLGVLMISKEDGRKNVFLGIPFWAELLALSSTLAAAAHMSAKLEENEIATLFLISKPIVCARRVPRLPLLLNFLTRLTRIKHMKVK